MDWYYSYPFVPLIPNTNEKPPTIYAILDAYCNGEESFLNENYVTPTNLAKEGKKAIFDFEYPLSDKVNKDTFEEMILNKFMMRRIGYESLTAFKIAFSVKLNEIMPKYNKLFDASINWDIFNDGEVYTRNYNESRKDSGTSSNNLNSNNSSTSDRRYSNVPQNEIDDIKDGSYMTDYNYDTDSSNVSSTNNGSTSTNGNTDINEIIKRSPADKFKIYKDMLELETNIYTLIFKDLEKLFYGLV